MGSPEKPEANKRKVNHDGKRALRSAELATFVRQYGRKAQRGVEPNDRRYSEEIERRVKRMNPAELDALLREDED